MGRGFTTHSFALAFALAAVAPAVAHADPQRSPSSTYDLTIKLGDKESKGSLSLVARSTAGHGTAYDVHAAEKADGKDEVAWSGDGTLVNNLLKVKRTDVTGITEALDESKTKKGYLEYDILFETGFKRGHVVIHKVSFSDDGQSHRSEVGTGDVSVQPEVWGAGELLVLTKDKIDALAQKGVNPGTELDLLKGYLHVGVKAGVRELADSERTGWMRAADEKFRQDHSANPVEPTWVEVSSAGTKAVGKDGDLDLGAGFTFTPGFRWERGVKYTVVKQYDKKLSTIPGVVLDAAKGVADALREQPVLVYDLPVDAAKGEAMKQGEQRSFEGWSSLDLSGTLEYGHSFKELFKDKEEVKFDGSASITWNRTGNHRLFIEKQFGEWIHVKWTKSSQRDLGLAASVVFGLLHNQDAIDQLKQPAREAYTAGVQKAEGFVTIAFSAGVDWVKSQDFEVDMIFDLGDANGRVAYEAAIKGDLAKVEDMAKAPNHAGIKSWTRTDTGSKALETSVSLDAFNLLKLSHSAETKTTQIVVQDMGGTSTTTTASATRNDDSLFGKHHKTLDTAATYKEVKPDGGAAESALRFEFTFERDDPKSSKADVADRFALARTLFSGVGDAPAQDKKKIATHTRLEIDLGSAGIAELLAAGDETFVANYGRANWQHPYAWNMARVNALVGLDQFDQSNADLREEIIAAKDCMDSLRKLQQARKLSAKPTDQVKKFRDLAKQDGYKLRAVIAFALSTSRSDTSVALTISSGEEKLFDRSDGTAKDLPEDP